jgi:hypothetical protein
VPTSRSTTLLVPVAKVLLDLLELSTRQMVLPQ